MRTYALLIRKDFISAMAGYTAFPLLIVMWLIFVPFTPSFIPLGFTLMIYALVIALFLTEENDLVCNVQGILPIRRHQAVIARYLYTYLVIAVQSAAAILLLSGAELLDRSREPWFPLLAAAISSCLLMTSISMPLIYRFGVVKMRMLTLLIYAAMIGLSSVATSLFAEIGPALFPGSSSLSSTAGLFLLISISFLLSLVSLGISLKLAKR